MPRRYKRNCNYCKIFYEGSGKHFCSYRCSGKFKGDKYNLQLPEGEIIKLYQEEKKTIFFISKIFKCSSTPIRRVLLNNKIVLRKANFYHNPSDYLGKYAKEGLKGEKSPRYGEHNSESSKEKSRQKLKKLWGDKDSTYNSPLHRKHLSLINKGKNNPFYGKKHTKETKEVESINKKKLWENKEYREIRLKKMFNGKQIKPNKPEKFLINLFKKEELSFKYVGDGYTFIGGKCPDFISFNPKYIIELFGDYWHNLPGAKEKDKERLHIYNKHGYKTLIIWEHELKNPIQVIEKIKGFILK